MKKTTSGLVLALLAGTAWSPATAQDAQADAALDEPSDIIEDDFDSEDVVVVDGVRRRGITLSDIEPEITLGEEEIASYGVSSIAELLEAIEPETSSGRGRRGGGQPVILLNGRRVSGFREIGRYPPEALARLEVLPEEAALAYGFSANQRVVNFVLKPNVIVRAAEGEIETPDQGGTANTEGSFQRLWVDGNRRFSIDVQYEGQSPLLESERNFVQEAGGGPFADPFNLGAPAFGDPIGSLLGGDPNAVVAALTTDSFGGVLVGTENDGNDQDQRTLRPDSDDVSVGFSRAGDFVGGSTLTFNGQITHVESDRLLGQPEVALDLPSSNPFVPFNDGLTLYAGLPGQRPLGQNNETDTYSGGFSLVSKPGRIVWTWTGSYEHVETETVTELGLLDAPLQAGVDAGSDPFAVLRGETLRSVLRNDTTNDTFETEFLINGKTLALPAGDVTFSAQVGARSREQQVDTDIDGVQTDASLSRDSLNGQISVDVPVLLADTEGGFGDLSLNANLAVSDLSDFGTLATWGGGFTWRPAESFRLIGSYTREEGAPSIGELGDPLLITPNVRVFDFTTGETVLVDVTTGGNPDLQVDSRRVSKLGVQWRPFGERVATINVDYTQSLLDNEARSFPALTPEIEAAFPDRFVRDASGRLTSFDQRAVNFAESRRSQIRTGINIRQRLSRSSPGGPPPFARGGSGGGGRPPAAASGQRPQRSGPPPGVARSGPPQSPQAGPPSSASGTQGGAGGQPPSTARPSRGGPPASSGRPSGPPRLSGRPPVRNWAFFHTWVLGDSLLIRDGVPKLDLLDGSALGNRGGTSAHRVTGIMRQWKAGLGIVVRVDWRSGTDVDGGNTGEGALSFSDLLTANTRLSYELSYASGLTDRVPLLRDSRVAFGVDNIFNERLAVTDSAGETPLQFQPDLVDPLGRVFEIEFRKRF